MKSMLFAIVAVAVTTAAAGAQGIDPQCSRMRDKVGCTCAVQNGGYVRATRRGMRWRVPHAGAKRKMRMVSDGYIQCLRKSGRS
jgi:hypothetical protein